MYAIAMALGLALTAVACGGAGPSGNGNGDGNGGPDADATPREDAQPGLDANGPPTPAVDCDMIWQRPGGGTTFYEDNPTYIDPRDSGPSWTFSTPEAEGMSGELLAAAAAELAARPYAQSFLVVRNGALVREDYFHGSSVAASNNVHSASKSMLSAITGIAIANGHIAGLDHTAAELLPAPFAEVVDARTRDITVRHLLTMTAGFAWTEDDTEYDIEGEADWVRAIAALPLDATPGTAFNYSTGQTHLLGAAVADATGMNLCEYAHAHLFGPLGITAEHWGRDPQGYFSGGYNVYLTARELARFGVLYANRGKWNGAQIVPESWVTASVQASADAGDGYDYGYAWWLATLAGQPTHIAWGYGGQLVYVLPELSVVVVITTNTRDFDVDYDGSAIIESYVVPAATVAP